MFNITNYINITVIVIYILYIIIYNITTQKYIQKTLLYDKMINKELSIIYLNYKRYKSIKYSRKFLTNTIYNRKNRIKVVYKKKCKVISKIKISSKRILIAVHSHISLFYQRYVLRKIYKFYKNTQLLFFVGLDYNQTIYSILKQEMNLYNDIVLFNFYSNYYNLQYFTYNFILWVKKYQHLFKIIIKQDTDTFLNINLLNRITENNINNTTNYILGFIWNYKKKEKEYPSGMCYIFSSSSIDALTKNIESKYNRVNYGFAEDLFFGYLARQANFTFYDTYHNFNLKSFLQIPDNLYEINTTFMIHGLKISEIAFFNYIVNNNTKLLDVQSSSTVLI